MKHKAAVVALAGAYRAECRCGWVGGIFADEGRAQHAAQQHQIAKSKLCNKVQFPSEAAAKEALLRARIRRVLRGSGRRREERCYRCAICQAWHLTSRP